MKRRVAAIDWRVRGASGPLVIIISGGLPSTDGDPDPKFAIATKRTLWNRGPAETFAEFRVRMMSAIRHERQRLLEVLMSTAPAPGRERAKVVSLDAIGRLERYERRAEARRKKVAWRAVTIGPAPDLQMTANTKTDKGEGILVYIYKLLIGK